MIRQPQEARLRPAIMSQQAVDGRHHNFNLSFGFAILALAIFYATSAYAVTEGQNGEPLIGPSITSTVAGRRIYLSVPLGGEFPLFYQKDGRVDGSGEAVGLGKFLSPTDSGTWWVDQDRLCQKWSQWYDGKVFCFALEKLPDDKLIWRRDDGEVGVARIGQ